MAQYDIYLYLLAHSFCIILCTLGECVRSFSLALSPVLQASVPVGLCTAGHYPF